MPRVAVDHFSATLEVREETPMRSFTAASDSETRSLFITSGAMFLGLIGVFVFAAPGGVVGAIAGAIAGAVFAQVNRS
jgi:uncharacterized membrane protein